ncbi:hypothetical protein [Burkholderia gladioli]|uniref:hypothetical protein n=1 Tax=Burkholderia gladioli TaxID=28095 RepID=UPI00163F4DE3|nr:hypothetical protein [Burkholderia gladioli]MBJ9678809.1 hypothetical protein [Burkholderia gladioli]MDN7465649.1 hypothetical protein [Burkholderia gladioli]
MKKFVATMSLALCMPFAQAADPHRVPAGAEVKLTEGTTDVALAGKTVRIVKGYVGSPTAHGYATLTSYLLPAKAGGTWLQIPVDLPDSTEPEFRTAESADSNVQAIAMYRLDGALYAVQAAKTGATAPDLYLKPEPVTLKVYRFNEDPDYARFKLVQTVRSQSTYLNASDALAREFFAK